MLATVTNLFVVVSLVSCASALLFRAYDSFVQTRADLLLSTKLKNNLEDDDEEFEDDDEEFEEFEDEDEEFDDDDNWFDDDDDLVDDDLEEDDDVEDEDDEDLDDDYEWDDEEDEEDEEDDLLGFDGAFESDDQFAAAAS